MADDVFRFRLDVTHWTLVEGTAPANAAGGLVTVVCEAGPDTGATGRIGAGRTVVGRSTTADVTVRDPALELHHLVLEVDDDGTVRVTQLTGRTVISVGDRPLASGGGVVAPGSVIGCGASRLRVAAITAPGDAPAVASVAALLVGVDGFGRRARDDGTMFRVHLGPIDRTATSVGADGDGPADGVATDLEPGAVVQVHGPGADGVARSMVAQLAAQVPPERLAIRLFGATGWLPDGVHLPHLRVPAAAQHVVAFVCEPGLGALDLPALRTRLGLGDHPAVVVFDEHDRAPNPALPGGRLTIGARGRGRWSPAAGTVGSVALHPAGIDTTAVVRLAPALAGDEPEPVTSPPTPTLDAPAASSTPATAVQAATAGAVDSIDIVRRWRDPMAPILATVGTGADGPSWAWLGAGPLVVVGTDHVRRRGVLTTIAAQLDADHPADRVAVVRGPGVDAPGPTTAAGTIGPDEVTARLLVAAASGGERSTTILVVDDDEGVLAATTPDPDGRLTEARTAGVHLVAGLGPDHPWLGAMLADPTATVVVTGVADPGTARRLAGDTRALRLGPGQVLVRAGADPAELRVLPALDLAARDRLAAAIAHAAALTGPAPVPVVAVDAVGSG